MCGFKATPWCKRVDVQLHLQQPGVSFVSLSLGVIWSLKTVNAADTLKLSNIFHLCREQQCCKNISLIMLQFSCPNSSYDMN